MKTTNILIPTDFSLASLNAISAFIQQQPNPDQRFKISLVHFLQLSDSISELLMLSRRSREYQYISAEFEEQLANYRRQYPGQIAMLHTEFFYGSTVAVFKNYLEAQQIDKIVALHEHPYQKLTQNSIDPTLLLQRSGYELLIVKPVSQPQARPVHETRVLRSKLEHQLL
jgi:hypothetical protein